MKGFVEVTITQEQFSMLKEKLAWVKGFKGLMEDMTFTKTEKVWWWKKEVFCFESYEEYVESKAANYCCSRPRWVIASWSNEPIGAHTLYTRHTDNLFDIRNLREQNATVTLDQDLAYAWGIFLRDEVSL